MVTRRQVRRALELHEADLSAHAGVVGIGAQWDTSRDTRGEDRAHAVAVYVASDERTTAASGSAGIPESVEIPGRSGMHTIPVVVKQIGELSPEQDPGSGSQTQTRRKPKSSRPPKADRPDDGEELFFAE